MVSIHAPAWGATPAHRSAQAPCSVSIHAPAWGATRKTTVLSHFAKFQFTLPHGERPTFCDVWEGLTAVSIHAPAWGATSLFRPRPSHWRVSIHAPAWGATSFLRFFFTSLRFQFTLPHGERPTARKIGPAIFAVSIHAPAWGATWTRGPAQASPWFQFTLPHGERPARWIRRSA